MYKIDNNYQKAKIKNLDSTAWNANEAGGAGQLLWVAEAPLTG